MGKKDMEKYQKWNGGAVLNQIRGGGHNKLS